MKKEDVEVGKTYKFVVEGKVSAVGATQLSLRSDEGSLTTWLRYKDIRSVKEILTAPEEPPVGSFVKRVFSDGSGSYWKRNARGWYRTSKGLENSAFYDDFTSPCKDVRWDYVVNWDPTYGSSSAISLITYTEQEEIICERSKL